MKNKFIVVFAFAFVSTLSAVPAYSQTPSSCWNYGTGIPGPHLPGFYDCVYIAYTFGNWTCKEHGLCPPPSEVSPCCIKCGACGNHGGAPISLVDGNTYIEETDVRIPGLSGGLTLERNWISKWPSALSALQTGLFGLNWRSTYEERIFTGSDNYVKYARSDGSFWSFGGSMTLSAVAPSNVIASLTADSGLTQWTLTLQNGERRTFNYTSGSLTSIIDRNGNTTQLTYDGINRLVTVTDPGGRHLYFSYASGSSHLVTSVTSDVGVSLAYAYDTQSRLTQVTEPDLSTLSFAYDSNSLISSVTDSNGKVLESHTYDSEGRGLTSTRANGVEAISVSYPNP